MDLKNSLEKWNNRLYMENCKKELDILLLDEENIFELINLLLESNEIAERYLIYESNTNYEYKTVIFKIVKSAIQNFDYNKYVNFLKKISKINNIYTKLEYSQIWLDIDDNIFDYYSDDLFKNSIFGCLWNKSNNKEKIHNDLLSILRISFYTSENWKPILRWIWNIFKNRYSQIQLINFDNSVDLFLFEIASIVFDFFIEYYNKFNIINISDKVLEKINHLLENDTYVDVVRHFDSKLDSLFLTCIYCLYISFIPMKHNYNNLINQEIVIENQILNLKSDFSILYEITKLNLIRKCNDELLKNKNYLKNINNAIRKTNYIIVSL